MRAISSQLYQLLAQSLQLAQRVSNKPLQEPHGHLSLRSRRLYIKSCRGDFRLQALLLLDPRRLSMHLYFTPSTATCVFGVRDGGPGGGGGAHPLLAATAPTTSFATWRPAPLSCPSEGSQAMEVGKDRGLTQLPYEAPKNAS